MDVPVLYVHLYLGPDEDYVTDIEEVYRWLVQDEYKPQLKQQAFGFHGSLTQGEHPVFGYPAFHIHPCQTAQFLQTLQTEQNKPHLDSQLLYLWLQTYGRFVSLDLPHPN